MIAKELCGSKQRWKSTTSYLSWVAICRMMLFFLQDSLLTLFYPTCLSLLELSENKKWWFSIYSSAFFFSSTCQAFSNSNAIPILGAQNIHGDHVTVCFFQKQSPPTFLTLVLSWTIAEPIQLAGGSEQEGGAKQVNLAILSDCGCLSCSCSTKHNLRSCTTNPCCFIAILDDTAGTEPERAPVFETERQEQVTAGCAETSVLNNTAHKAFLNTGCCSF